MRKKFLSLFVIIAITIFTFMPFVNVWADGDSRVQIIMSDSAGNNYGTYTVSGGGFDSTINHNNSVVQFVDISTNIIVTATANSTHTFKGWYNAEEYDITGDAHLGVMGWRTVGDVLSTNSSYTFNVSANSYNIMPVFESRAGHNNIWATSGGQIAVLYENRDEEQTSLDGEHWVDAGMVVDYWKGDSIIVKARANDGYHFVGWFQTDPQASVAANYVREPVLSTSTTYTYQPGVTTVPGVDEPINYITAAFEEDTNPSIIRVTTTIYHTIVEGNLTITGDDSFSKNYKSGDIDNREDYIDGSIDNENVVDKINEYREDMNVIAANYRTTVTIDGEISSYYYDVHDEITEDMQTGVITINTVLDKYQVYTLTGTAESRKVSYTLDDEKGNQIIFKDYEGIIFAFSSTDILNITEEELQAIADEAEMDIEDIRAIGNEVIEAAQNAVKGKGTLVGLYDFSISNAGIPKTVATGGFKIRIKMTDEMKKYNDFSIAFLKDDGTLDTLIKLTQNGDYLEGILPHLSTYAVIGNVVEDTPVLDTTNNPATGDNILFYILLLGVSLLGFGSVGIYAYNNTKSYK